MLLGVPQRAAKPLGAGMARQRDIRGHPRQDQGFLCYQGRIDREG